MILVSKYIIIDKCQLTITEMSNIKEVHCKPSLHALVNLLTGIWSPCCTTLLSFLVIGHAHMRSMLLAMLTMKKSCIVSISMHACGSALLGGPFDQCAEWNRW